MSKKLLERIQNCNITNETEDQGSFLQLQLLQLFIDIIRYNIVSNKRI